MSQCPVLKHLHRAQSHSHPLAVMVCNKLSEEPAKTKRQSSAIPSKSNTPGLAGHQPVLSTRQLHTTRSLAQHQGWAPRTQNPRSGQKHDMCAGHFREAR